MILSNFVKRHSFGIFQPAAQNDVMIAIDDGVDEIAYVQRIVLAVSVHSDDNISSQQLGCFNSGFSSGAFSAINLMS